MSSPVGAKGQTIPTRDKNRKRNTLDSISSSFSMDTSLLGLDGNVNTEFFVCSPSTLWYNLPGLETQYVRHRGTAGGGVRFMWVCFWIALFTGVFRITMENSNPASPTVARLAIEALAGLIGDAILRHIERTLNPSWTTFAREAWCTATLLAIIIEYGQLEVRTTMGDTATCDWVITYDDRPDDTGCHKMLGLFIGVGLLPIIVGRPRFVFSALVILAGLVSSLITTDTDRGPVTARSVIFVATAIFYIVLKYIDEQQHRNQFETQLILNAQTKLVHDTERNLLAFALSITPHHLRKRLLAASGDDLIVDVSDNATAVAVDVFNVQDFVNSMLPTAAAVELTALASQLKGFKSEMDGELHHIHTSGDTTILVGGLFNDKSPLIVAVVEFLQKTTKRFEKLAVRCGVARGSLVGLPVGSACIRYDVFGPALTEAQSLLLTCAPRTVHVSPHLVRQYASLSELIGVDDADGMLRSATTSSTSSASTRESHRNIAVARNPLSSSSYESLPADSVSRSTNKGNLEAMSCSAGELISVTSLSDGCEYDPTKISKEVTVQLTTESSNSDLDRATHCCITKFASSETSKLQSEHQRRYDQGAFQACCAFFAFFAVLIAIIVILDKNSQRDFDVFAIVSVVGLFLVACGYGALGVLVRANQGDTPDTHLLANFLLGCLLLVFTSLSRPSVVGNDPSFTAMAATAGFIFCGSSLAYMLSGLMFWCLLFFIVGVSYQPLLTTGAFSMAFSRVLAIGCSMALYRQEHLKELFCMVEQSKGALAQAKAQRALREAVMEGTIPKQLLHLVTAKDATKARRISAWGQDDCIIMHISWKRNFAVDGRSVQEMNRDIEARTALVEAAVAACPKKSIDIIKMIGGTMIIGGRLQQKGKEDMVEAATDALAIIYHLILHTTRSPSAEPSRTSVAVKEGSGDVPYLQRCSSHDIDLSGFTVGVAVEQVINSIRFDTIPAYDAFGPAVNISRALMVEAPTSMVAVTNKFAQLVERECKLSESSVVFSEREEKWRIRSLGIVHIRRVFLAENDQ